MRAGIVLKMSAAGAMVLSMGGESQMQALDRSQPGLPLKKGRCGAMSGKPLASTTHGRKRHGATTLFAALNVLNGGVAERGTQRQRHQELIHFPDAVEADVPAGKLVHVVLDNHAVHKHSNALAWQREDAQLAVDAAANDNPIHFRWTWAPPPPPSGAGIKRWPRPTRCSEEG